MIAHGHTQAIVKFAERIRPDRSFVRNRCTTCITTVAKWLALVLAIGLVIPSRSVDAAISLGPTAYTSFADSPFFGGSFKYFYLEDFEDGSLSTPGVAASGGFALTNGDLIDSVDGDDGAIDGSGSAGYSWYSNNLKTLVFTFDALTLGALPTHVGIVWTDVGFSDAGLGYGHVEFEAFDELGDTLGVNGPSAVGDGVYAGQTAEDRFLGVVYSGGISKISISMPDSEDWEVDHLQYGEALPDPASLIIWSVLGLGFAGAAWRRRNPSV